MSQKRADTQDFIRHNDSQVLQEIRGRQAELADSGYESDLEEQADLEVELAQLQKEKALLMRDWLNIQCIPQSKYNGSQITAHLRLVLSNK